jgi:hypothetical protein
LGERSLPQLENDMSTRYAHRHPLGALAFAAALAGIAAPAAAQNFEAFYGDADSRDRSEDVKAVRQCKGEGSILVGTRTTALGNSAALVTRVDPLGVPIWQRSYRVGGAAFSEANAVVEYRDGSGFAITGSASPSSTYIYVMRLDCEGEPRWTLLLANQADGHRGIGFDIIEAPASLATVSTGDVVVVGDERLPVAGGTTHGRIARVDAFGNLVYNNAYVEPERIPGLRFRAATLARSSAGTMSDVVIAGSAGRFTDWNFDRRGLMFRARLDGTPICNAMLGVFDSPSEDYLGVTRIAAPAFSGQTLLVGTFTPGAAIAGQQGYLTRFRAGNCEPLRQSRWPFPGGETAELADVAELPAAAFGNARFAVVGTVRGAINPSDGFVAEATTFDLAPLPFQRFGQQQPGIEVLRALDPLGDRVLAAGHTDRDWQGVGDPRDSYLVQTDPALRSQCSLTWTILPFEPAQPHERFEPEVRRIERWALRETPSTATGGFGYCCALGPG